MRDLEMGRLVRALRRRRGWRQEDCARRAGVHRSTWSNLERGRIAVMSLKTLRSCAAVVGVDLELTVRGDRARFDRILDERHAALQARWAAFLRANAWQTWAERSFSHFGERGRVDILAWHGATRTLAVVEIKTELADSQELLGGLDTKTRLGHVLARELGLPDPLRLVPVLIFAESMTTRRRISRLAPLFERFDLRGRAAQGWLRRPTGAPGGLLMFSTANHGRVREQGSQRVRLRRRSGGASERGPGHGSTDEAQLSARTSSNATTIRA